FYSSIKIFYYWSLIFGCAPYKFIIDTMADTINIKRTIFSVIQSAIAILVVFVWMMYTIIKPIVLNTYESNTTLVVSQIITVCFSGSSCFLSLISSVTINIKKWGFIFEKVLYIDKIILREPQQSYKKTKLFITLQILVTIVLLVSFHAYETLSKKNKMFYKIAMRIFVHVHNVTVTLQFINLVLLLSNRLKIISERLEELSSIFKNSIKLREQRQTNASLFDTQRYSLMGTSAMQNSTNNPVLGHETSDITLDNTNKLNILTGLKQLREVHHIICDILNGVVNSIYGLNILILSTYMFLSCVKYVHLMMIMVVKKPGSESLDLLNINSPGMMLCFIVLHLSKVVLISVACNNASQVCANLNSSINSLLLTYPSGSDVSKELQLLSIQTIHSKLEFTAFDFFPLDFTYFHMFLAGVTTYTVILLQFA
ncbi:hypothetical protein L9F63_026714, partial [Diploptera punctata]